MLVPSYFLYLVMLKFEIICSSTEDTNSYCQKEAKWNEIKQRMTNNTKSNENETSGKEFRMPSYVQGSQS